MTATPRMDRRALFASGAAAALLAATGVSAASLPRRGGRLRLALPSAPQDDLFDPQRLADTRLGEPSGLFLQVAMIGTIFETLTEVSADGTLRGELATGWRSDAEAAIWDFDLRPGVTFHDGTAFTAEDLTVLHGFAGTADRLQHVAAIVPTGRHAVRFELSKPDPQFPFLLAQPQFAILPQANSDAAARDGVGTGPYRLHKFDAGRHLIARRVEGHYKDGRAAWFDTVELAGIASDAVRAEALREHFVDAAYLTHAADLGGADGLTYLPEEGLMSSAVARDIGLPAQMGTTWPLDNLRAPQRWWMA